MINIFEAEAIAQRYLGQQVRLHACKRAEILNSLYNFDAAQHHVFNVEQLQEFRIGGDRYVAVHKIDGSVRDLGYLGE